MPCNVNYFVAGLHCTHVSQYGSVIELEEPWEQRLDQQR